MNYEKMTPGLKNCPFCGGGEISRRLSDELSYYIACWRCGAGTELHWSCDLAEEAWNRRVGDNENQDYSAGKFAKV